MEREEVIEVYSVVKQKIREAFETLMPELRESEDERIRKAIESIIRVYGKTQGEWIAGYDMDTLVVHLRDAFALLEEQKEQKPAEWSEEDKERIQRIRDFLMNNRKGDTDTIYQIEKDADWLKSLRPRPHWKPREEQMAALLSTEGLVRANNYPEKAKILASLYKNLKNLM